MKIEAGKKYLTRNGGIVFCVGYLQDGKSVVFQGEGIRTHSNGGYYNAGGEEAPSPHDIIAEYHEPEKRTLDVILHVFDNGDIFVTNNDGVSRHANKRIACIRVTREYEAGEGL